MDFLLLPGAVIGFVFGAAVGWGISMLIWGEPHVPMITTLVVTCWQSIKPAEPIAS